MAKQTRYIVPILIAITVFISQYFGSEIDPIEPQTSEQTAQVVSVTDGDTITVEVNGRKEKVRYIGIDTPEPYRDGEPACFSKEASARNQELVAGQTVRLVADREDRDRFGRLLRYVYVDDVFVNRVLVEEGYATTLSIKPNTRHADEFSLLRDHARDEKRGLWGVCE